MKSTRGFTVLELLVVVVLLVGGSVLFFTQKAQLDAAQRDNNRKTAINAMYYNLEEVYYEQHQAYPASINSKVLRAMDPELFTDPDGVKLSEAGSNYRYESEGCTAEKCTGYKLLSIMEKEADYVKTNRNK